MEELEEVPNSVKTRQNSCSIENGIPLPPACLAELLPAVEQKEEPQALQKSSQHNNHRLLNKPAGTEVISHTPPHVITKINVAVKPTVWERLKRCAFTSTRQLVADENATFDGVYWDKLAAFMFAWQQGNAFWFNGLPPRNIAVTLVSVVDTSSTSKGPSHPSTPYICIKGLRDQKEITAFHAILSQKMIREKYRPLRLCYDRAHIRPLSAKDEVHSNVSPEDATLCGKLVQIPGASHMNYMSTIGGILEVDGSIYAITTAHRSAGTEEPVPVDDISSSSLSTLATLHYFEANQDLFDSDLESALILDEWKPAQDVQELERLPSNRGRRAAQQGRRNSFRSLGQFHESGSDWLLFSIKNERLHLPNCIELSSVMEEHEVDANAAHHQSNFAYFTSVELQKRRKTVHIITGKSGVCSAILSQNPSYLLMPSGHLSTWTVHYRSDFGKICNRWLRFPQR